MHVLNCYVHEAVVAFHYMMHTSGSISLHDDQQCYNEGQVPDGRKSATVCAVHKKGLHRMPKCTDQ